MARKFLPALSRATQRRPGLSGAASRSMQSARYYPTGGQPYQTYWSTDRAVAEGLERNTYVYKAVDAIAARSAELRVGVRLGDPEDGEWQDPTDRYINKVLNKRSNPDEISSALRYRVSALTSLSKRGVFVEVVLNRARRVAELRVLPVDSTLPIPALDDQTTMQEQWATWAPSLYASGQQSAYLAAAVSESDKLVASFQVTYRNGRIAYLPPFDPENPQTNSVIWIRKPHPVDPFLALTPFEAAGLAIDTSYYAKLFNRNFMQNDGRPGGILAIKGEVDVEDASELKSRFNGGVTTAGRVTVMEADAVDFIDTATNPRDAQYVESSKMTKDEILLAFGTPESVLGNASGRTFDNADAEEEGFWRITMRNHLSILEAGWDQLLDAGALDDNYVRHDLSRIGVLQREQRLHEDRLAADLERGAITIDQYLEETGRPAFNVPATRCLWIAAGKIPVASGEHPEDQPLVERLVQVGSGTPADPAVEARRGAIAGSGLAQRHQENRDAAAELRAPKALPYGAADPFIRKALEAWVDGDDDELEGVGVKVVTLEEHQATRVGRLTVEQKAALENTTGIMVCLKPEGMALDALDRVADTPRDEIHLTLGYLGQIGEHDDVTPEALFEMVEQAVRMSAAELAPLAGEVSGWTRFKAGDEGRPTVALADVPGLNAWRESLMREINRSAGFGVVYENHGYTPHITLGYELDGEGHDNLDSLEGLRLDFDQVYLVWGEDWHHYPLEGDFDGSLVQQVAAVEGAEWQGED